MWLCVGCHVWEGSMLCVSDRCVGERAGRDHSGGRCLIGTFKGSSLCRPTRHAQSPKGASSILAFSDGRAPAATWEICVAHVMAHVVASMTVRELRQAIEDGGLSASSTLYCSQRATTRAAYSRPTGRRPRRPSSRCSRRCQRRMWRPSSGCHHSWTRNAICVTDAAWRSELRRFRNLSYSCNCC